MFAQEMKSKDFDETYWAMRDLALHDVNRFEQVSDSKTILTSKFRVGLHLKKDGTLIQLEPRTCNMDPANKTGKWIVENDLLVLTIGIDKLHYKFDKFYENTIIITEP
jgi:hypothetical protein